MTFSEADYETVKDGRNTDTFDAGASWESQRVRRYFRSSAVGILLALRSTPVAAVLRIGTKAELPGLERRGI
jgi:hypothetical protein